MQGFVVTTNRGSLTFLSPRNHSPIKKKFVNPKVDFSNSHNSSAKSRFSSSLLSLKCLPREEIVPPLSGTGKISWPKFEKTSWPELVGTNGDDAASVIKRENPKLIVEVILDGSLITLDLMSHRVRVFVDKKRIVSQIPTVDGTNHIWTGPYIVTKK